MRKRIFKRLIAGTLCICLISTSLFLNNDYFLLFAAETQDIMHTDEFPDSQNELSSEAVTEYEFEEAVTEESLIPSEEMSSEKVTSEDTSVILETVNKQTETEHAEEIAETKPEKISDIPKAKRRSATSSESKTDFTILEKSSTLLGAEAASETDPSVGIIDTDTTWSGGSLENGTLTINPGVTLTINAQIRIEGNVIINGGGTIARGTKDATIFINGSPYNKDYSLELGNITIDGKNIEATYPFIQSYYGKFTMKSKSRITNCHNFEGLTFNRNHGGGGGAVYLDLSDATLYDEAVIENCTAKNGGAIYLYQSHIEIHGGTYQKNRAEDKKDNVSPGMGGFLYNSAGNLCIYGGNFLENTAERAGCIFHNGEYLTSTNLYGGYFRGNTADIHENSTEYLGSGAIVYYPNHDNANGSLTMSGNVQFDGKDYEHPLADGIYLNFSTYDDNNSGIRKKLLISSQLNYPLDISICRVSEPEGYVIAKGSEDYILTDEDADKITLHNTLKPDEKWYAVLDKEQNHIYISKNDSQPVFIDAVFYSGENKTKKIENISPGDTLATPDLEEINGWNAVGWDREISGYGGKIMAESQITLSESTSFYGIYKKEVTLSYDLQDGGDAPAPQTEMRYANVHQETTYLSPSVTTASMPSRPGYEFAGWNTQADGKGIRYAAESTLELEQDMTLYAEWTPLNTTYLVEHYLQSVNGDNYIKDDDATETLTSLEGQTVTAIPKDYIGFSENTSHTLRVSSGTVNSSETLVLKLYYDRNLYEVDFDLNGANGTAPAPQTVCYGGLLQTVEEPVRRGYHFGGWYTDTEYTNRWIFENTVEQNTTTRTTTLYAKWVDDIAPVFGEISFNEGYKNILNWIIRKKSLIITVPVTEEGSGLKEVRYLLQPDEEINAPSPVSAKNLSREGEITFENAEIHSEDGQTVATIAVEEEFCGKIVLSAVDNVDNKSADKSVTTEDGNVVVEDNAPEIEFQGEDGPLLEWYYDSVFVNVSVSDDQDEAVSGGLAHISYRLDDNEETKIEEQKFDNAIITNYDFSLHIDGAGEHTLTVTAVDHAGNENTKLIVLDIRNHQASYQVQYYCQDVTGDQYTLADTEYLAGTIGDTAEAYSKTYAGFTENTTHAKRRAFGTITEEPTLVLSLYYDRDTYNVQFDLNGADGTAPKAQTVRYGNFVQTVNTPTRKGYHFYGWYTTRDGAHEDRWDFEKTVENNSTSRQITLYAKWIDDIAPIFGNVSFNKGYTNLGGWIIRKKNLIVTVPVTEEGSGIRRVTVTRKPQKGTVTVSSARIINENGTDVTKFSITEDFKGTVTLTCTDKAGNKSAQKSVTAHKEGIIVEDNAPEISFSSENQEISELFDNPASIRVDIKDELTEGIISGGIAKVTYTIDNEKEIVVSEQSFHKDVVTEYDFTANISDPGEHSLRVTAVDNAGNKNTQSVTIGIRGIPVKDHPSEPKTADSMHVEIYATLAMIAGFAYLLLLFTSREGSMTQEEMRRKISAIIRWADGGGKLKKVIAVSAIFLLMAYYYSIGKCGATEWKKVYAKRIAI